MKAKTTNSATLKMPDSEIKVGLEAARKPLITANQGPKLKKPITDPMAETFKPAKDQKRMVPKNLPKRKKW